DPQRARCAGGADVRRRRGDQCRAAAGTGLGRIRRPVHQRRRGDRDAAAAQARPAAADRDGHRWRVPAAMRVTPAALRPWRRSIRARIVIACTLLFLVPGAILIGAAYTQVGYVRVIPPGPRAEVALRQGNVTYFYDANN